MPNLVIIQPYVPAYRVPFFERLIAILGGEGIECRVAASMPDGAQAARGDAQREQIWSSQHSARRISAAGRTLDLGIGSRSWQGADAVICSLQGTSLDTYRALLSANLRVGLWGHVASYVSEPHPVDRALETWQARRADRIFAYTPSGASAAVGMGVAPDRVTTVMNAVDTETLVASFLERRASPGRRVDSDFAVSPGKTFGYVGGLDSSKRIDLLVEALDRVWAADPEVRLLVGGRGVHEHLLEPAVARGQVKKLGYADDRMIANIAAQSEAFVSPGRIGLLAVQSLALGLPILSTKYRYHAPEVEYLREDESLFKSEESPEAFAGLILANRNSGRRVDPGQWSYPTIDAMAENYAAGVIEMMS